MIIKHVEIKEFGPLEDFSADLLPGVNLIEGVNESGKSSIIGFLRFVLYGLPARRGEEGAAERDRALSWKSSAADGSITVESEGKEYRIERRAAISGARESCTDRVRIIDLATGSEVHKGEVPGRVLLGVSQTVFDSTACIRQLNLGELDGAGVGEAIENMLFSADATVSVKNALNRLGAARRSLKNARGEGRLTVLERRRDELAARLERAEQSAVNIREAQSQAERCRSLASDIRKSLNANEDRLSAYGGLQTLRRFDMLHAGERKIAQLREQKAALEADGSFGGYLPDREYAPALDSAARRLDAAESARLDAYESVSRIRGGRIEHEELADIGDAAQRKLGDSWESDVPREYAARRAAVKRLASTGAILLALGLAAVAAGAVLVYFNLLNYAMLICAAVIVGVGAAAAVAGAVCLAVRSGKKRRCAALAEFFAVRGGERSKVLPTAEELEAAVRGASDAASERAELRALLSRLDAELAQKSAATDAALDEARGLLEKGGVKTDSRDVGEIINMLTAMAERARGFCEEREKLARDIDKYETSVEETASSLAGEDETALRARIAPVEQALAGQNLSDLKKARDFDRARLDKTEARRVELEKRLAALEATAESPVRLYPQWEAAAAETESCRRQLEAITLASSAIEGAGNSLRLGVTPRLRRDAGAVMSELTGGKYTEFGVGTDLSVTVGTEAGTRPVSALSVGTRDAAYFSLRRALVGLLFPRSAPPLLFDESLAMMDDDRARGLLASLCRRMNSGGGQCLIFTCQSREETMLDSLGEKYNCIRVGK